MAIELFIWGIAGTVVGGAIGVASSLTGKQRSPYKPAINMADSTFTSVVSLPIKEGKGELATLVEANQALNETNHILCQVIEASAEIPAVIEFVETTNSFHSSQNNLLQVANEILAQTFSEKGNFKPALVATASLATLAGKILVAEKRNEAWRVTSAAPERSARAVLHSIPSFADDYTEAEQQLIRRALLGEISFSDTTDDEVELAEWVKIVRAHRGGIS